MSVFPQMASALDGLNEAQRYAVGLGDGPILVIAGAGTGKTRTLVHRVAHLVERGVPAPSILLLTFTRRAAEEMLGRARALNPDCARVSGGTFHSVANRLLRQFGPRINLDQAFTIMDPADARQIIKGIIDERGLKQKGDRRFPKSGTMADIISKSRNLELGLEETLARHYDHLAGYLDQVHSVAGAFQEAKRSQHLVDYDDLLFRLEELLDSDSELRRELGRRWQHILVDEYQDTNAVQARILKKLCTGHSNLMVVGDDAQSIYAFRGARLQNILDFPRQFKDVRLVKLEQNYRSTQPILDLTNQVISQAAHRYEKNLFTELGGGPVPELLRPREQKAQSREVLKRIKELLGTGVGPQDIAVIFRAGRDSFDLENELKSEGLGFVKYGGVRFVELAHVKDLMAHLRVLANPQDFLSWQRLLLLLPKIGPKTAQQIVAHMVQAPDPSGYIGRLAQAPQAGRIPELVQAAAFLAGLEADTPSPMEMVERALEYYEPICIRNYEDYPRRIQDLKELPGLASQSNDLVEFLAETVLDPPESDGPAAGREPLTLTTAHSAKGKEWPHVFLIWASDGRFPPFPSLDDPQALEEERRLMYVACTRAGKGLTILSPREHYHESSGWRELPASRFFDDLSQDMLKQKSPGQVFDLGDLPQKQAPASRGTRFQNRPFAVGANVSHQSFGPGKVMGYKGKDKVIVHFQRFGLKILLIRLAKLEPR